ncbi:DUF4097 family beta strand repeat-containing protein [Fulvivirga maritima]|uniref:DUF4097 family beta strand repeat-containing protein n=1 Tax=Fulvivirga maritima TaxID=2904247 RepID=UPI001F1F9A0E|nr:DUF4097 family beta strand repeat-containing protein [Fulvivirga maritima]UII29175.1 DUF4097 family beta strand repeat-containing protein [Fulvivirga maritima]
MKKRSIQFTGLVVMLLAVVPALGQSFKMPMTSGILYFNEVNDVQVQSYSGKEVIIETNQEYEIPEKAKGLKPLNGLGLTDNTGIGLAVKDDEQGQKVVYQILKNSNVGYKVKVPNGVNVKFSNSSMFGKDFIATDFTGELEVKSSGGKVALNNVSGPIIISTVHGDVEVVFADDMNKELPSSINSAHGDVDVSFSKSANVDLQVVVNWGEVYSGVDVKVDDLGKLNTAGEKKIIGKLGNGGVALSLSSVHGNVYLREK